MNKHELYMNYARDGGGGGSFKTIASIQSKKWLNRLRLWAGLVKIDRLRIRLTASSQNYQLGWTPNISQSPRPYRPIYPSGATPVPFDRQYSGRRARA